MAIDPKVFKAVRKRLGLSQQELADALGLSRVTINKMERGRLKQGIPDEIGARLLAIKPAYAKEPMPLVAVQFHKALQEEQIVVPAKWAEDDDAELWDNEEDDQ
jgi:transcriptional regulator with XRE-family HTH domain